MEREVVISKTEIPEEQMYSFKKEKQKRGSSVEQRAFFFNFAKMVKSFSTALPHPPAPCEQRKMLKSLNLFPMAQLKLGEITEVLG